LSMTRSSSDGGGSAGGGCAALGCPSTGASPRAALRASRRDCRLGSSESAPFRKGRDSPKNGGGDSRQSPAATAALLPKSGGNRNASLSLGGDKSSGICTGNADRAVAYRVSGSQVAVCCWREQPATAASPTIAHQVREKRMLCRRDLHARSRHRFEHGGVILRGEWGQRQPNAGADQAHALHGPLDGNRVALTEQFGMQRL